ncbi:MAG TPA: I78 family peptidase inhibitor [Sphingomicrobium sp.]|nr:I78 family peptidase inhibitor [Sphingomicrobium sp.]
MRNLALVAPALLMACSTTPAAVPVHGSVPGHVCDAAGADRFVGQPATSETGAQIMRATNSAVLRWAPPGMMMTMEFSASRVTVRTGPDNRITAVNCG